MHAILPVTTCASATSVVILLILHCCMYDAAVYMTPSLLRLMRHRSYPTYLFYSICVHAHKWRDVRW
jgi:hypothetical protein